PQAETCTLVWPAVSVAPCQLSFGTSTTASQRPCSFSGGCTELELARRTDRQMPACLPGAYHSTRTVRLISGVCAASTSPSLALRAETKLRALPSCTQLTHTSAAAYTPWSEEATQTL